MSGHRPARADDPVPLDHPPRDPNKVTPKDRSLGELESIYGLNTLGIHITSARIVGRGSRASADVYLDNGETITFDSLRDAARPSTLLPELAASVGATPALKQSDCLRAVTLLRLIASQLVGRDEDDIARDWGISYLQATDVLEVDMSNQAARWAAFVHLHTRRQYVLRHHSGTRYVRCIAYRDAIRERDTVSAAALATRMERVGWQRPGSEGRVKATCPSRNDTLQWAFYLVPSGWEG